MMKSKDFLKEIENLAEEAEAELSSGNFLNGEKKVLTRTVLPKEHSEPPVPSDKIEKPASADKSKKPAAKTEITKKPEITEKSEPSEKHVHYGHRARVKSSWSSDPDFVTFSDIETLEYLLFNTIPRIDTNELAHKLIDTFGSFSGVLNANINELKTVPYINESTARMLTCILPAARKAEISRLRSNVYLHNTLSAVQYLQPFFMNRSIEYLYLTSLNNSDRIISVDLISTGDTNYTGVDTKKIIETASRHKATKALIAHNHPSGTLKPSEQDRDATGRLSVALISMNVLLVDHILFTPQNYYSFFANQDFEAIYHFADKIFKTNLVQELALKVNNYRDGVYPSGNDSGMYEDGSTPVYSEDRERMSYSIGHPDPKNFKIKF